MGLSLVVEVTLAAAGCSAATATAEQTSPVRRPAAPGTVVAGTPQRKASVVQTRLMEGRPAALSLQAPRTCRNVLSARVRYTRTFSPCISKTSTHARRTYPLNIRTALSASCSFEKLTVPNPLDRPSAPSATSARVTAPACRKRSFRSCHCIWKGSCRKPIRQLPTLSNTTRP